MSDARSTIASARPVTQFDDLMLIGAETRGRCQSSNHGRQMAFDHRGQSLLTMTSGGAGPKLQTWRSRETVSTHILSGEPSAPVLLQPTSDTAEIWLSIDSWIWRAADLNSAPQRVADAPGAVLDACSDRRGRVWVIVSRGGPMELLEFEGARVRRRASLGNDSITASMQFDSADRLHLCVQRRYRITYGIVSGTEDEGTLSYSEQTAAEPYGSNPVLIVHGDRPMIAYLGESCRRPGDKRWSQAWQRMGRGGYIALLVQEGDSWRRFTLADSSQIVVRHRPIGEAYGGGPHDQMRVRIEEFGPPALCVGPDEVPQVIWPNLERRWVYSARFLGAECSNAIETRGPIEGLLGPCLLPKQTPAGARGIPAVWLTKSRCYLDELALPRREVTATRTIDFAQSDSLSLQQGVEAVVEPMRLHASNPVIAKGTPGTFDDAGVVADVARLSDGWRADYAYRGRNDPSLEFHPGGEAVSSDGLSWTKLTPRSLGERYQIDGSTDHRYSLRFLEDASEPAPQRRFKGLFRSRHHGPWGWVSVISPDARQWTSLLSEPESVIRADDDLRIWIDELDLPERKWKATAIGRSFCGRIAAMWWSADGINWRGVRDTLDVEDPFAGPVEPFGTGRVLLDSWAGPADEDEIHGGFLFREGDRMMLHYMKWTADGHICCALASSIDGLNFSRVCNGAVTIPLGAPGTWNAGRVAIREAPFQVGQQWRQYFVGSGWKHGLAGVGAKTSPWGIDGPTQMGVAEIDVGRWVHLRLRRDTEQGQIVTTPLELRHAHRLYLNVDGLQSVGAELRCELLDASTNTPLPGFSAAEFDALQDNGFQVAGTWNNGQHALPRDVTVRIRVVFKGWGVKFYGMKLVQI
jgi:hypothetical protein